MAMPMRDFRILEKSMMQTTSDNDAEALVALRAANAILAKHGYNWTSTFQRLVKVDTGLPDVEEGGATIPRDVPAPRPQRRDPDVAQINEAFLKLERCDLPHSSEQFIMSLKEQWDSRGFLSDKQKASLFRNMDEYA